MLIELEDRGGDGQSLLSTGHAGDPLAHADGYGQVLAEMLLELGLVVERVDVRRPAGHKEIDDPLGLRGEMELRQHPRSLERVVRGAEVFAEERGERCGANPGRGAAEELEASVKQMERRHIEPP